MEQLSIARPHILRLYFSKIIPKNAPVCDPSITIVYRTSPSRKVRPTVSKSSNSRTSRPAPAETAKPSLSSQSKTSRTLAEWSDLASYPGAPRGGTEIGEVARGIIFQALAGAWISLLVLGGEETYVIALVTFC